MRWCLTRQMQSEGSAWGRHLGIWQHTPLCCLISWLACICVNGLTACSTNVCLRHSLAKVKAQPLPAQIAPLAPQATKQAASCCALGLLVALQTLEAACAFEQVMDYEVRRLSRMAEGAPDEQRSQAVAQQSSQGAPLQSAKLLLSSLQQIILGQYLCDGEHYPLAGRASRTSSRSMAWRACAHMVC